jgi:uncharacterized protein
MAIYFEWDTNKASANIRDHGVSFPVASFVFRDVSRITEEDSVVDREQRLRTIGIGKGTAVLIVIYLEGVWGLDTYVRIISARRATPGERGDYEQNRALHL